MSRIFMGLNFLCLRKFFRNMACNHLILYVKPCLKTPEIASLHQIATIAMAQVAQHPPGLTATNWHPDPDKEIQDLVIAKTVKKMKNQTMDSLRDDVHEGKVPEYDMACPDDPEP